MLAAISKSRMRKEICSKVVLIPWTRSPMSINASDCFASCGVAYSNNGLISPLPDPANSWEHGLRSVGILFACVCQHYLHVCVSTICMCVSVCVFLLPQLQFARCPKRNIPQPTCKETSPISSTAFTRNRLTEVRIYTAVYTTYHYLPYTHANTVYFQSA